MIQPKLSWNEYFGGSPETTLYGQYNSRQNPSVSSVYVLNCLFNTFTSGSTGGALYCNSATSFLIELSSFFSCKTSGSGGAIYFCNSGAQSVLYGVCGYDCCTTNNNAYQFAYIYVKNDASSKNCVNYSSITRCVNEFSSSSILCFDKGKIYCPSVNSSMNKCKYYSGITCYPSLDSNSFTCSLLYSTFADNTALDHLTFYLISNTNEKYEMKCCNILRNTHTHGSYGIISTWGNLLIEDSCILENNANYIFYSSSSTITLSNCTVDKTTTNGNLVTKNTVTNSFILGLNHISTQNCHSGYDSVGTLTAIPYVSSPTKKLYFYTCKIYHCQGNMSAFLSIAWLLMFIFIHPNPSVYF
jgi:hypothetical protein